MKKYLLFAGHRFYPLGGFNDFCGSFSTINDAVRWFDLNPDKISTSYVDHWCHVVDKDTFEIVGRFEQKFTGRVDNSTVGLVTTVKEE